MVEHCSSKVSIKYILLYASLKGCYESTNRIISPSGNILVDYILDSMSLQNNLQPFFNYLGQNPDESTVIR